MPSELTAIVQQVEGTRAVIAVSGSMDLDSAGVLREVLVELIDQGRPQLVLEMSQVGFCDSSGLNTLLQIRQLALARQGSLALVAPTETVVRLLRVTEVDTVIPQYPNVAAALLPLES